MKNWRKEIKRTKGKYARQQKARAMEMSIRTKRILAEKRSIADRILNLEPQSLNF